MIDLKGKTILITGASSGIGKATAILCDRLGADTILTGRTTAALQSIQENALNKSSIFTADLTNETEINDLVDSLPMIDGMAHCAGIVKPYPIKYIKTKNIDELFSINFNAAVLLCSSLLQGKKINQGSSVVFISSVSSEHPYTGGALYSSSKAALEAFSKTFALENASKKIRANIVSPAIVKTGIWEEISASLSEEELKSVESQYPLGIGNPEDVANAIVFLLSEASAWITGTTLKMDGGLLLKNK